MTIRITRLLYLGPLAIAAACVDRPYDGRMRGEWDVSMTIESDLPGRSIPPGTTVSGTVTVPDPTPVTPRSFPEATPADVHLDLRPFGLRIPTRRQPLVRDLDGGGVRIELGSTPNELVLVGQLADDSVTGFWTDQFRAGGAIGHFVMRRKRQAISAR